MVIMVSIKNVVSLLPVISSCVLMSAGCASSPKKSASVRTAVPPSYSSRDTTTATTQELPPVAEGPQKKKAGWGNSFEPPAN